MSGADKFSSSIGRLQADVRYYNNAAQQGIQGHSISPPSISASVPPPAPHPFIAHFYPIAPGIEQLNPGYQIPTNTISQPSSAAALVALAASGCVGQNLSSQLLRNIQSKAHKLAIQSESKHNFARENISPPAKKQRQQFDVVSLTDDSPSRAPNAPSSAFTHNNFVPYHQGLNASSITAWHQLLRRFRGGEAAPETHQSAENSSQLELLRNYYDCAASSQARSSNPGQVSGFTSRGNESHFTAKNLYGASMFQSPERMVTDSHVAKRSSISKSPQRRCTSLADTAGNEFSPQSECTKAEGSFTVRPQPTLREVSRPCSPGCQESRDTIVDVDSPFPSTNGRCLSASPVQLDEMQRNRRRKRSSPMVETCPVCGVTVRPSEVVPHMQQELESLERIPSETRKKMSNYRRSSLERRSSTFRCQGSTSATSATSSNKRLSDRDLSPKTNRNNRRKTYQKVRSNRVDRLNARVGHYVQPHSVSTSSSVFGATGRLWGASTGNGSGHLEDACCPVCSSRLSGSLSSVNDHVEACLRRQRAASRQVDEEELVDVEGNMDVPSHNFGGSSGPGSNDDDRSNKSFGSEYEWCGQSRVRASALAESTSRLATSSGYHVIRPSSPGNDQFLNVEADDTQSFGPVQFTEEDLNSCRTDTDQHTDRNKATKSDCLPRPSFASTSCSPDAGSRDGTDDGESPLHHATMRSLRCNICMDTYTNPVASIQCWHVHCERCWLRALSVKKLCPQCNAITTATKLRRIFL